LELKLFTISNNFVCVIALLLVKLLEYISAKKSLSMSTKVLINVIPEI